MLLGWLGLLRLPRLLRFVIRDGGSIQGLATWLSFGLNLHQWWFVPWLDLVVVAAGVADDVVVLWFSLLL